MKKNLNYINIPTPSNISNLWNLGSILSIRIIIQSISGFLLTLNFNLNSFNSIISIQFNTNFGWIIRTIHRNLISLIFIIIYIHILRNIYFHLNLNQKTWISGSIIFFLLITISFTGYTLTWRQISYWGATVITNILSLTPFFGKKLILWTWNNYNINKITLNRIISIHYFSPLIIIFIIIIHIISLHSNLSNNPLGLIKLDFIPLNPLLTLKDLIIIIIIINILININLTIPHYLNNYNNFISINPISTPFHIQPEWYFLFFYAILRSTPNKLGGIILILFSIIIILFLPFFSKQFIQSSKLIPIQNTNLFILITLFIILRWTTTLSLNQPFISINKTIIFTFFLIIRSINLIKSKWIKFI